MKRLYAQHSGHYTVSELCGLFGKSKQAYYKHNADLEKRRRAIEGLTVRYIAEVREKDPGIGGLKILINNTHKNELLKDKVFHNIDEVREAMASAVAFYNKSAHIAV